MVFRHPSSLRHTRPNIQRLKFQADGPVLCPRMFHASKHLYFPNLPVEENARENQQHRGLGKDNPRPGNGVGLPGGKIGSRRKAAESENVAKLAKQKINHKGEHQDKERVSHIKRNAERKAGKPKVEKKAVYQCKGKGKKQDSPHPLVVERAARLARKELVHLASLLFY